jgi:hypothetical protein
MEQMFRQMIDQQVPEAYEVNMLYAKSTSIYCPPPQALTRQVVSRLKEPALLFNYIGHGFPTGFDSLHWNDQKFPILTRDDLAKLSGWRSDSPMALLTCCSAGWFDLADGEQSMAEAMILNPAGPIAVIAGSRQTHPYCNGVLEKDVLSLLLVKQVETIGELDLLATRSMIELDADDRALDAIVAPIAALQKWQTPLPALRRRASPVPRCG